MTGNGHSKDMLIPPMAPSEYVDFMVGGQPIRVRALSLDNLIAVRDPIRSLDAGEWFADYAAKILRIIAILTTLDADGQPQEAEARDCERELIRTCSTGEARELAATFDDLLSKSGFTLPGEAAAAGPGIGTSTDSSPNSPPEGSVAETPAGSSDPTR